VARQPERACQAHYLIGSITYSSINIHAPPFTDASFIQCTAVGSAASQTTRVVPICPAVWTAPAGVITEFALPTQYARADGITAGPDGAMYFTESPNNFTFGAIGRIQAVTPVVAPPPPPPAVVPPPPPAATLPTTLTLSATPKRKRTSPFRYTLRGRENIPARASKATVCSGNVTLTLKKGSKTLARGTAKVSKTCTYSKRITISRTSAARRRGKLAVRASFGGNSFLKSSSKSTTVRLR
jgi:hypothetical protein